MRHKSKFTLGLLSGAIVLIAALFGASAQTTLARGQAAVAPEPRVLDAPQLAGPDVRPMPASLVSTPPLAGCSKLQASDVAWVTLTDEGDIDEQVEAYPPETNLITPLFEYNCVPKKASIVTIFKLDGEEVFSDKESVKATNAKGIYAYPLGTDDNSPLPEGVWEVEFYNNKTLLTSGQILVGGEGTIENPTDTGHKITVGGLITDKKSKKPIKNAVVLVLKPGITVQDFIDGGKKDKDVFTAGQSDTKGQFVLNDQLERNVDYSIIVVAKGYKATAADGIAATDDDPDPLVLNITMNK
jgi:hypothetical protein